MPKYLFRGSYSQQGMAGVMEKGGSSRVAAARELAESVGGTLESHYFAFGHDDFFAIADLPDHVAAIKVAGIVGESGAMREFHTTVLITAEEFDAAAKVSAVYRPPGR